MADRTEVAAGRKMGVHVRDQEIMDQIGGEPCEEVLLMVAAQAGAATLEQVAAVAHDDLGYGQQLVRELIELGLVSRDRSMAAEATLTGRGRSIARQINTSLENGARRDEAVRREVLRFARDKPHGAATADPETIPTELEPTPTQDELTLAAQFLKDRQMITTYSVMTKSVIIDAITSLGQDVLNRGDRLTHPGPGHGSPDNRDQSQTNHITAGPGSAVSVSRDGTATATVTNLTGRLDCLQRLEALIHDQVDGDDQEEGLVLVDDVRDALINQSPTWRVRLRQLTSWSGKLTVAVAPAIVELVARIASGQ